MRLSAFDYRGGLTVYDYEGEPNQKKRPVNSRTVKAGELVSTYVNLEPRASIRYSLNENSSLKASYNRTAQYIHLSPADGSRPYGHPRPCIAFGYLHNFNFCPKTIRSNIVVLLLGLWVSLSSCEDVVDARLEKGEPLLVVDGWITDQPGPYTIRLKNMAPYFNNSATTYRRPCIPGCLHCAGQIRL